MTDFFVTGQCLVEEVEQIIVQRHHRLHELDVGHEPRQIIGEQLDGRHGADPAGIKRGGMHMATFHQAKHLAREAAHLQSFAIKFALKRIERGHDVGDGAVAMVLRMGRRSAFRLFPNARIGFAHHHFAKIHAHQVVLINAMVEHVFRRFAEVDDPFAQSAAS